MTGTVNLTTTSPTSFSLNFSGPGTAGQLLKTDGSGNVSFTTDLAPGNVAATGAISGASVAATGAVSGATVTATGAVSGASVAATGALSGASVAVTGSILSSGAAGGLGYSTGSGGTIAQSSSKSTTVVLNKPNGQITMNAANLAAGAIVSFTLTNSFIAATDVMVINMVGGGTVGAYVFNPNTGTGNAVITVTNISAGGLAEAIVLSFFLLKSVTS